MSSKKKGFMYPSVKFLRASANLETFTAVKKCNISQSFENENGTFSGAEARGFYESLLKEPGETPTKCNLKHSKILDESESPLKNQRIEKKCMKKASIEKDKKRFPKTRQENLFLKMAQDGDINGIHGMVKDNKVNINARDQFGWTALMCAAKSGHKASVKFLLREGADINLRNNTGESAKDIAKQSGVYDIFYSHRREKRRRQKSDSSEFSSPVENTCDICMSRFTGPKQEHDTSTAHLFNCQYNSDRTFYHIPEDNIGFKLMKQIGWDKEKGLGPEGTGRKFPIKTILKQDRRGLGNKRKEKAKITHFSANDTSAVESTDVKVKERLRAPRRTWKRNLMQKQEKERMWEHNLRVYMNTE